MSGDKLTVTEADRDAATDMAAAFDRSAMDAIRSGGFDHHGFVQAFARHRTNTTTELVEALRRIADCDKRYLSSASCMDLARKALTLHDRALGK